MTSYLPFLLILLVVLAGLPVAHESASSQLMQYGSDSFPYGVMRPDKETLDAWVQQYNSAQKAPLDTAVAAAGYAGSLSLLPYLQYTPSERNQGFAGNCWVWAGTGVTEVALDVQTGVKNRLSIQYFDSNYAGGGCDWAGCGGDLTTFAQFYSDTKQAIPWSNTNAAYNDFYQCCHGPEQQWTCPSSGCGGPFVASSVISVSPYYGITSITDQAITTQDVGQPAAIDRIKNVLNQNRAVYFWFVLANQQDWNAFYDFWDNQPETAVWNPDQYSGHSWISGEGGSHAVLVVGYDDTNPANRYWIILNSWGTGPSDNRPNGLFRMKMDINYDDYFFLSPYYYYSLYWQTLAVNFSPPGSPAQVRSKDIFDKEFSGVRVKVEWRESGHRRRTTLTTPFSLELSGQYRFTAPSSGSVGGVKYYFARWEDESGGVLTTSKSLTYDVQSGKTFYAVYGPKQYRLTVYVKDTTTRKPVAGATVEVTGDYPNQHFILTTNSRGKVVFSGIYGGQWLTVTITKDGYQPFTVRIFFARNTTYRAYLSPA